MNRLRYIVQLIVQYIVSKKQLLLYWSPLLLVALLSLYFYLDIKNNSGIQDKYVKFDNNSSVSVIVTINNYKEESIFVDIYVKSKKGELDRAFLIVGSEPLFKGVKNTECKSCSEFQFVVTASEPILMDESHYYGDGYIYKNINLALPSNGSLGS